jgi:hypothetical protein
MPVSAIVRRASGGRAWAWLALYFALGSRSASAEVTKDQCVDANTRAQSLRREGKFGAARDQLALCMNARCPEVVQDDCTQRFDELERAQPTLVFDVKDRTGQDVLLVHVSIDGLRISEPLDGRALVVDPGEHAFTFDVPGEPTVTHRFVLKEGEKARRERIVVTAAASPTGPSEAATPKPSAAAADLSPGPTQRTTGWVLGAAGLVGIAVGAVFGALTIVDSSNARTECRSAANCSNHEQAVVDHDRAVTAGTISTVGFLAGSALLASGIVVWLTSPSRAEPPSGLTAIRLSPSVGPTVTGLALTGGF